MSGRSIRSERTSKPSSPHAPSEAPMVSAASALPKAPTPMATAAAATAENPMLSTQSGAGTAAALLRFGRTNSDAITGAPAAAVVPVIAAGKSESTQPSLALSTSADMSTATPKGRFLVTTSPACLVPTAPTDVSVDPIVNTMASPSVTLGTGPKRKMLDRPAADIDFV
jgi:hypothetical protein